MQSLGVSNARCFPEKSSSRARGVFSNKTRFVFAHEAHLCHRTDFLFEALVAMLRTCVFLRHPYISAAQLQEWSMRKRVTYRASPEYGLISIFHSVKKMHISSRHTHNLNLEMPNVHCLSLDPCTEWVSFFGSRIGNVQC